MSIQESGEMYLETILILSQQLAHVRSIDIAEHMNYSRPSVSRAVGILRNDDYITMDDNGYLMLTDSGRKIAETIYERHRLLSSVLEELGVDAKTAAEDACRIEHVISETSMEALKKHISLSRIHK